MSYQKPVTDDGSLIEYQYSLSVSGNAATQLDLLTLNTHTDSLFSVDLLEIGIVPVGETALNSRLPSLRWQNGDMSNDSGTSSRPLVLVDAGAGLFSMEYNFPLNLYKFQGSKHRPGSQRFTLSLLRTDGEPMNTSLVRMRFRVRYYDNGRMEYNPNFMSTILSAPA